MSNDTTKCHIEDLSRNVQQQTIAAIKCCKRFSLQLDETTDIEVTHSSWCLFDSLTQTILSAVSVFPLIAKGTTEEICKKVDFFKEHQLEWSCVCADDAPAMIGNMKDFHKFHEKRKMITFQVVNCLLHIENLSTKDIQENLAIVFKELCICGKLYLMFSLNTCLFRAFCDKIGELSWIFVGCYKKMCTK